MRVCNEKDEKIKSKYRAATINNALPDILKKNCKTAKISHYMVRILLIVTLINLHDVECCSHPILHVLCDFKQKR